MEGLMRRLVPITGIIFLIAAVSCVAQSSAPVPKQDPSAIPPQGPAKDQPPPAVAAKPKKVWTNENLADASGPVSVVGDPKNPAKNTPNLDVPADPQYVASVRKQLDKLQTQIADTNKQLTDLKNFSEGAPSSSPSKQLNKGYNQTPVDQQIAALQEKKKQTKAKIDALFDEARKKGVEPGQLR
jgi:hypothetical protein